ncbi:hypothetical protein [Priestia megaterium]|uniref:hypothetical protein n=1 Tax=Priestia megaterium TaxID=1404 RepID=UPI0039A3082F
MAKRNKTKLKKRKQRQLKKAFKHSESHSQKVEPEVQNLLLNNSYLPPYKEPKEDTNKKHEERNKAYQKALDKVYKGTVIPLVNYSNAKSILLHKCTGCNKEFYGKPGWLVAKEDQRHVCYFDNGNLKACSKSRQISEEEKLELCELAKAGTGISKLARNFGISKYKVNKVLKEAGIK